MIFKKMMTTALIVVVTFVLILASGCAKQPEIQMLSFELDGDSYTVTGFTDEFYEAGDIPSEITVPSEFDGVPVSKIGSRAFSGYTEITKIAIEDGVTEISSSAFYSMDNLKEVVIPSTVKSIGTMAFYKCKSLETVVLPNSLTEISDSTFYQCSSLKSINIPLYATKIGEKAFLESGLTEVTISDSVDVIGAQAFQFCRDLIKLNVGDGVVEIGTMAFDGCNSLNEVTFGGALKRIGQQSFQNCSSIESLHIPSNVRLIYPFAFDGCTSLKSISFERQDWIVTTNLSTAFYWLSYQSNVLTDFEQNVNYFANNSATVSTDIGEIAGQTLYWFWGSKAGALE